MNFLYDKILIVSRLHKCAENGVFALNISAVENKCVVFNIVCRAFCKRIQPTIDSLYNKGVGWRRAAGYGWVFFVGRDGMVSCDRLVIGLSFFAEKSCVCWQAFPM